MWTELRGGRDDDMLIISAYRVSKKKVPKIVHKTAYAQQINSMIPEGNLGLNPCTRILFQDLKELVTIRQAKGIQPHIDDG